ncbi:hypothetical protein FRC20_001120 [Serendipita sp. 405]|nr:hypothetical protein FRC18_004748 [Serendipita sp. 400]KAG8854029.1 hypothetical protein FRC20_001120 [Serendipita sp. 405]
MSLDIWKFVHNVTRLRRRTPIIRCRSGEPASHEALADAECEQLGDASIERRYMCQGAVNTVRLLQLTRATLFEDAKEYGATALIEEGWTCDIFRRGKDTYEVVVRYSAIMAKASKASPATPVAIREARGVPGMMTILRVVPE